MKLELHLDWKRTVKTIMTMRGLSNSDLAQAAGTTDATMRQVINKSVKGAVMNKVSEYLGITNPETRTHSVPAGSTASCPENQLGNNVRACEDVRLQQGEV